MDLNRRFLILAIALIYGGFPIGARADLLDVGDGPVEEKTPVEPIKKRPQKNEPIKQSQPLRARIESAKEKSVKADLYPNVSNTNKCRVFFKSEELEAFRDDKILDLITNVQVERCNLKIKASKARVYFEENSNRVKEVQATGKIMVTNFDQTTRRHLKAYGQTAVFNQSLNEITMKGDPAKVVRGGSTITGKQIKYNLNSGTIKVSKVKGTVNRMNSQ